MTIGEDIINAGEQVGAYYKKNYCNMVCKGNMVVPRDATQEFLKLKCKSCHDMVNYVVDDFILNLTSIDWDTYYNPNSGGPTYRIQERYKIIGQIMSIVDYSDDICDKVWGLTGQVNTNLTIDQYKNPLISGLNEFFEEENIRHRKYMTSEVAPANILAQESRRCKSNARMLLKKMVADIHRKVNSFDIAIDWRYRQL